MNIVEEKWDEILNHLKLEHEISDISFNTWLKPLEIYSVEDGLVTLLVKDSDFINFIEKRYATPLRVSIIEVTGSSFDVRYITEEDINKIKKQLNCFFILFRLILNRIKIQKSMIINDNIEILYNAVLHN